MESVLERPCTGFSSLYLVTVPIYVQKAHKKAALTIQHLQDITPSLCDQQTTLTRSHDINNFVSKTTRIDHFSYVRIYYKGNKIRDTILASFYKCMLGHKSDLSKLRSEAQFFYRQTGLSLSNFQTKHSTAWFILRDRIYHSPDCNVT